MKVVQLRKVLTRFGGIYEGEGAADKAAALHNLAKALKAHDSKTVGSFVKQHKKRQNQHIENQLIKKNK